MEFFKKQKLIDKHIQTQKKLNLEHDRQVRSILADFNSLKLEFNDYVAKQEAVPVVGGLSIKEQAEQSRKNKLELETYLPKEDLSDEDYDLGILTGSL